MFEDFLSWVIHANNEDCSQKSNRLVDAIHRHVMSLGFKQFSEVENGVNKL